MKRQAVAITAALLAARGAALGGDGAPADPTLQFPHYGHGELASIATGDFDGDTLTDVIAGELVGNDVVLFRNRGAGLLHNGMQFVTDVHPERLIVLHLNSDDTLDVVTANSAGGTVAVLFGLGDGFFAGPFLYDVGPAPSALAAADFDDDGDSDIVVALPGGAIRILRNETGLLVLGDPIPVDAAPSALDTLFADADDRPDLVIANASADELIVYLNTTSGWVADRTLDTGATPRDVQARDLEGDGDTDLVAATDEGVRLFRRAGDDYVAEDLDLPGPRTIVVDDLSGDGLLDLATAGVASDVVAISLANASGFDAPIPHRVSPDIVSLATGDLDGDGDLDLAVAVHLGAVQDGHVTVLTNLGAGVFEPVPTLALGTQTSDALLLDVDGDGIKDLASSDPATNAIAWARNDGRATFATPTVVPVPIAPEQLAVALNGTVAPGLFAAGENVLLDLTNDAGTFVVRSQVDLPAAATAVAALDLDADENDRADALIAAGGSLLLCRQGVNGLAAPIGVETAIAPTMLATGDLDGDGRSDLVALDAATGLVALHRNAGDGTLPFLDVIDVGSSINAIALGDVDGDGDTDVMVTEEFRIALYPNLGSVVFGAPLEHYFEIGRNDLALGDIDLDGDLDAILTWQNAGVLAVVRNLGAGLLVHDRRFAYRALDHPVRPLVDDLDGDGLPDVIVFDDPRGTAAVVRHLGLAIDPPCPPDLVPDDHVDALDLVALVTAWGPCSDERPCPADLDASGRVGLLDLLTLLARWGPCP